MSFFDELKRRNVIRVAFGYAVVAWLVIQIVETIFPAFGFGDEAVRFVVIAFAVALIPVLVLSWVFEWTPEGIRKDEDAARERPSVTAEVRRWDRLVTLLLAVAVTYFIVEKFLESTARIEPIVAVLPFENLSADPEQAFFSIGVSESVHTSLARIPTLIVSAWPTVLEMKRKGLGATEIARSLEAPNVLEGTVQTAGDRVRVTARLIAVASDTTLWTQTYDRDLGDIFAIQDEIASDVVANLRVRLLGEMPTAQRTHPETRVLTTQAWSLMHAYKASPEQHASAGQSAVALLDRALQLDPNYVQAWMARAFADLQLQQGQLISSQEANERWQAIKERVLAIDPENGLFNTYLAWEAVFEGRDFESANRPLQLALGHALNDLEALRVLGSIARRTGHVDAAVVIGRRAEAIDPTCARCLWQLSESLFYARRFEEAIDAKRRFQLLSLGGGGYFHHALSLLMLGDHAGALEVVGDAADEQQSLAIQAMVAHSTEDSGLFIDSIDALQQISATPSYFAEVFAWARDADRAFEWMDKAVDAGELVHFDLFLPIWDPLHDDPRWAALRERLGWTEEQVSKLDFSLLTRAMPDTGARGF